MNAQLSSPLTPILDSLDFLPGCKDQDFKVWSIQGLKKIGDLFKGQILLSFQQLHQQFGLFNQGDFSTISCVEKAPSLQISKKSITVFYGALNCNSPLTSQTTMHYWEIDLGAAIDDAGLVSGLKHFCV